ncbi:N-acetylmuramoyl-L-alanine amidase [Mesonia sp. JHPTF-M18]|uniref:N-acetylmuramoyl-L-alanine amidase n=1 Tax=Mesonia aestuariivivens TaxID=2796128 RepID=A0ABS6W0P9_9FLAO|nr:N-acetylmuramoyl-L-alanine amidase [Mesonia aestuariivivens]
MVIDTGHGGKDPGSIVKGISESELVFNITKK